VLPVGLGGSHLNIACCTRLVQKTHMMEAIGTVLLLRPRPANQRCLLRHTRPGHHMSS
jgi:hypothetical protein